MPRSVGMPPWLRPRRPQPRPPVAKEMFVPLHQAGEILLANEIESYAVMHGWKSDDAKELAQLGSQIGMGKKPRIKDGPWWKDGLIEQWQAEV